MTSTKAKAEAKQPLDAQFEEYATPLDLITTDAFFKLREAGTNKDHVRDLTARIREVRDLDPVLLWQGSRGSGGLTILDGEHRIEAYRSAKRKKPIPAIIVHCDRRTALLLAMQANTKVALVMTGAERSDLAWRLVRHPKVNEDHAFTKPQIVRATGVGHSTVDNMRKRLVQILEDGGAPTGKWLRDRKRHNGGDWEGVDDAERRAMVRDLAKALQKALDVKGSKDDEVMAEALQAAFGSVRLRNWFDYLHSDEDDEGTGWDDEEDQQTDF